MAFTREQKRAWRQQPEVRARQREHQRRHRTRRRLEALNRGEILFGPRWAKSWFVAPPKPVHPPTYRHGMRYTAEYSIRKGMIQRCTNPNNPSFARYGGGRGVTVCSEWRQDFLTFLHDMGRRPSPLHVLTRIDKDLPYTPTNTAWTIRKIEADNRRGRHVVIFNGQKHCLAHVVRPLGLSQRSVEYELERGHGVVTAIK